MITVALPNHANPIVWLAMESLCSQIIGHAWELIVFEDSDDPKGKEFYKSYMPPFYKTDVKIESILSKEIIGRL